MGEEPACYTSVLSVKVKKDLRSVKITQKKLQKQQADSEPSLFLYGKTASFFMAWPSFYIRYFSHIRYSLNKYLILFALANGQYIICI